MRFGTDTTTLLATVSEHELRLDGAELVVQAGPDRGQRLTLGAGPLRIGTAPDCDLVLSDGTVSSYHAEVDATASGYLLRDLQSKNGVRLGGLRVQGLVLEDGVRLQLGATVLRVRRTADAQTLPLAPPGAVGELVARSLAMRAAAAALESYAGSELAVLIEGETGTGKELAARALHERGPRRDGPFVVVDLPAISGPLVAAELFGHERGAFTGALAARAPAARTSSRWRGSSPPRRAA